MDLRSLQSFILYFAFYLVSITIQINLLKPINRTRMLAKMVTINSTSIVLEFLD